MSIYLYISTYFSLFQDEYQLWINEKLKLCAAYNRFVKSATKLKKTDGPDFFNPSNYKVLTYFQNKSSQTNDDIEDMDIDDEVDENDDDYEDIPDEVIFSPES